MLCLELIWCLVWGSVILYWSSENRIMYNKQQLKPLSHKKTVNNNEPVSKAPISKELSKAETKQPANPVKPGLTKKASNGETAKPVKYERSTQRSNKTIEHYDCDDFGFEMEDNHYFETQL